MNRKSAIQVWHESLPHPLKALATVLFVLAWLVGGAATILGVTMFLSNMDDELAARAYREAHRPTCVIDAYGHYACGPQP